MAGAGHLFTWLSMHVRWPAGFPSALALFTRRCAPPCALFRLTSSESRPTGTTVSSPPSSLDRPGTGCWKWRCSQYQVTSRPWVHAISAQVYQHRNFSYSSFGSAAAAGEVTVEPPFLGAAVGVELSLPLVIGPRHFRSGMLVNNHGR